MKLAVSLVAAVTALAVSTPVCAAEENDGARKREIRATFGVVRVGTMAGSAQSGVQLSMTVGSPSLSFAFDIRAADDGIRNVIDRSTLGAVEPPPERSLGFASASTGARHDFSDKDFSPFVGGGLAVEAISLASDASSQKNTGIAGYAEVGLDVLRTNVVGGTIGLRIDAPTFELKGTKRMEDGSMVAVRTYTPIVSAAFSLRF